MPGSTGPNLGLVWGYSPGDSGWGIGSYNPGFARLDTLVHLTVLAQQNAPPGSPADGARYIVGGTPTGAWSGQADKIAVWLTIGTPAWVFYAPKVGWRAFNVGTDSYFRWNGTTWVEETAGGGGDDFDFSGLANNDIIIYDSGLGKFVNARPSYPIASSSDSSVLLTADQDLLYHRLGADITFPANFASYRGMSSTAGGTVNATANTIISVQLAPAATPNSFSTIGTITIGAGTVNPTFATTGGTSKDADLNDVIRLRAPASPDATFKGFYSTLVAFRR